MTPCTSPQTSPMGSPLASCLPEVPPFDMWAGQACQAEEVRPLNLQEGTFAAVHVCLWPFPCILLHPLRERRMKVSHS